MWNKTHLWEREAKSGPKNDAEECQPTESQFNGPWETVERSRDDGAPDSSNRLAYNRAGDKPESNDPGVKRERNDQLSPPTKFTRAAVKNFRRLTR